GGGGYSNSPYLDGNTDFSQPINLTAASQFEAFGQNFNGSPEPMQWGGGGSGGGGSGGGGGGFGGGQPYTAKGGVIAIMATQEMHDTIEQALNQVDKPPKQVYIEAIFINTDKNPIQTPRVFGVENFGQWAFEGGGDRFFGQFDVTGTEGLVFSILPKNQSVPYDDFRMRFQYLFDDRYARIVTAPRVAVIDGYTATISVNESRPFIIDGGIVIDQFGNAIPAPDQVTMIPTGTTLTITPFVDDYGNITMNLSPNQSQMLGEPQMVNGNLIWGTVNNQVSTTLRLRDGETIILGGMTTRNRDVNKKYLPLLGDIPLIGQFFGRKSVIETESQLVILLTVHLVGN
ncbi:type II and III secretion system protein, partial [bacterium]|nr:type II and III secretion system protein [bacterium]